MADTRITATGTVPAPPEAVFGVLADPARHQEVDGAGMLRGLVGGPSAVTGVGDTFDMDMAQEGFGSYRMRNTITEFESNRRIAWAPMLEPPDSMKHVIGDMKPGGHVYGWVLTANAEGGTDVEHFCDWSNAKDPNFVALLPRVNTEQMAESIQRVGKLAG